MDLKPQDIIQWFRAKAKEFNQIADSLENTFPGSSTHPRIQDDEIEKWKALRPDPTLAEVMNQFGNKNKRASDIAVSLRTTTEKVEAIISANPEYFQHAERGWVKLKEGLHGPASD